MPTNRPSSIHSAGPRPGNKPRIYNRPWHLDADDRRHHGRRKWDPGAVEAFLALASQVDQLYPPDFSARDVIRFRVSSASKPIAQLRTGNPTRITLVLQARQGCTLAALRKAWRLPVKLPGTGQHIHIEITSRLQVDSRDFVKSFTQYVTKLHELRKAVRPAFSHP